VTTIKRSVFFGGSFDPPHVGHLEMLLSLAKDSWTQKVFVVPTSVNPLKTQQTNNNIWSNTEHRSKWISKVIEEAKESLNESDFNKIELCDLEISKPNSTAYTVETLSTLRSQHKEIDSWSLAIGSDLLESLPRWKEVNRLLSLLESVWVFPRGKEQNIAAMIPADYQTLCPFRIMGQKIPDVSSSEIRIKLEDSSGGASCKNLLPSRVLSSIQELL